MVRRKADACKDHVIDFQDHAGRPAKMTWSQPRRYTLPPLPNLCVYFVHPGFSLEGLDLKFFSHSIMGGEGDLNRFELFVLPGGTCADCADHYRRELEARGDVMNQAGQVMGASGDAEYAGLRRPTGKLPGLVKSRKSWYIRYHGVVVVFKGAVWDRNDPDKRVDIVQFDPAMSPEDYESDEETEDLPVINIKNAWALPQPDGSEDWLEEGKGTYYAAEDNELWQWYRWKLCHHLSTALSGATWDAWDMGWTSW
ncbi:hypothetical protein ACLX1H_003333 [Fusarium chlamydosporum]